MDDAIPSEVVTNWLMELERSEMESGLAGSRRDCDDSEDRRGGAVICIPKPLGIHSFGSFRPNLAMDGTLGKLLRPPRA
jgi:hypothetical protein